MLSSTVRPVKTNSDDDFTDAKIKVRPAFVTNYNFTNPKQKKLYNSDSNVYKTSTQTPPINMINMKL